MPACPKKMASIWKRSFRCLSTARKGSRWAQVSKASPFSPKPKLRASVIKKHLPNCLDNVLTVHSIRSLFARIFPSVRQSSMSGRWKGGVKEWCGNKGGSCLFPTVPCSWCGPLPGRWVVFGGFFLHCSCWFPYLFRRLYAEWQSCNRHLHDVRVWTSLKIFHVSRYCLSKAHRPAWAWH